MKTIIELQETLETYSLKRLTLQSSNLPRQIEKFFITKNGKCLWVNPFCPFCKSSSVVQNGYYLCEHSHILSLGLQIRIGHYQCKCCRKTFSLRLPELDNFIQNTQTFLQERCFQLFMKGLTFCAIAQTVTEEIGVSITDETARDYYLEIAQRYHDEKVLESSGYFCVDCQRLKVNGNEVARLSVVDAITKKCLVDVVIEAERNEEIIDRLRLHLLPYKIKGFVVDGKSGLQDALKKEFGAPVQLCVMHFQKLIVEDYEKVYGKHLGLLHLRNQYMMLSILVDHDVEVDFLNKQLERLEEFRKSYIFQSKQLREEVLANEKKRLVFEFYEFRESLYRHRRKGNKYLIPRTESEIMEKLRKAELFLIEKHEKARLAKMKNEWTALTQFLRVEGLPPTNNPVEHYYSKTLTKTKKKQFRALDALKKKIAACRVVFNGWFRPTITFKDLLQQYALLFRLFYR